MNFFSRLFRAIDRQVAVVLAISDYDRKRQATGSSVGAWESIIGPLQLMLFFIVVRVGFSFLRGSNRFAAGGSTDMYFNIVVFMATGFCIAFLFRNVAIKALAGLKLRAPLYYPRVKPLDVLLALSVCLCLATVFGYLGIVWYFARF